MKKSVLPFLLLILLLVAVIGGRYAMLGSDGGAAAPAEVRLGGPFTMTDHKGQKVTEANYKGKLQIFYFGYTFCPDVCPTGLQTISSALDLLGEKAKEVTPIFITVDPARDNVTQMASYVANFHPSLVGLTGTDEQTAAITRSFRAYAAKAKSDDPENYSVDHSALYYLMNREGKYLMHFGHGIAPKEMAEGIKKYL
jgi:protein SCO1/2